MISYKNLGFRIMVLNDNKYKLPRNFLVTDRAIVGDVSLPPPPKHFKYVEEERYRLCFYTFTVDKSDPPLPASLLNLSKMPIKRLLKSDSLEKRFRRMGNIRKTRSCEIFEKT